MRTIDGLRGRAPITRRNIANRAATAVSGSYLRLQFITVAAFGFIRLCEAINAGQRHTARFIATPRASLQLVILA